MDAIPEFEDLAAESEQLFERYRAGAEPADLIDGLRTVRAKAAIACRRIQDLGDELLEGAVV